MKLLINSAASERCLLIICYINHCKFSNHWPVHNKACWSKNTVELFSRGILQDHSLFRCPVPITYGARKEWTNHNPFACLKKMHCIGEQAKIEFDLPHGAILLLKSCKSWSIYHINFKIIEINQSELIQICHEHHFAMLSFVHVQNLQPFWNRQPTSKYLSSCITCHK